MPAALLLVACSGGLAGSDQSGAGGKGGTVGPGGTGGIAGKGGTVGSGGLGGVGGLQALPDCPAGTTTLRVCIVSDADTLPLRGLGGAAGNQMDSIKAAAATVEAIGSGPAPAQCDGARVFGGSVTTSWWMQVRTADTKLWTIGLGGLANMPTVQTGDSVKLDLDFRFVEINGAAPGPEKSDGFVQLSDGAGTPLLWAGSNPYGVTWLSLARGQPVCNLTTARFDCPAARYEVAATVNGSAASVAPFSTAFVGGYFLTVGEYDVGMQVTQTSCAFDAPPPFAAAAVKAP